MDEVSRCAERMTGYWETIAGWFAVHAPPCQEQLVASRGAEPSAVDALEVTVGETLPDDVRAHFLRHGGTGGVAFFEYSGLSVEGAARRWRGLGNLLAQGVFDGFVPRELAGDERVLSVWWSPGWLPFAQDGGGNLYCVDLDPPRAGARGQVIAWEVHGGPTRPLAPSFEEYLRHYRDELSSGRWVYDAYSGIFDRVGAGTSPQGLSDE